MKDTVEYDPTANIPGLVRVAIVGAGLHGIAVAHELLRSRIVDSQEMVLVDPHAAPAALWARRVARCGMRHLRSPGSHTLAASLAGIARTEADGSSAWIAPYHRPSIGRFAEHVAASLASVDAATAYRRATVTGISSVPSGDSVALHVRAPAGTRTIEAECVVLALGQPPAYRPPAVERALASAQLGSRVSVLHDESIPFQRPRAGERVLVVGGGIAAVHAALSACAAGARVTIWHDRPLTVHQFDSDPCFIGPLCSETFRRISDPSARRDVIRRARRSGSVPRELYVALSHAQDGGCVWRRRARLDDLEADRETMVARGTLLPGGRVTEARVDRVVAATGFAPGPPGEELLRQLARHRGAPRAPDGYPIPDVNLEWCARVFVTGALAELEIGPPARNIIGAHLALRRIVPAIARLLGRQTKAPKSTRARRPPREPAR